MTQKRFRKKQPTKHPEKDKIAGRNINNLRYADDTTLIVESEEELKSLLMKVKEESKKVGLKLLSLDEMAGCWLDEEAFQLSSLENL